MDGWCPKEGRLAMMKGMGRRQGARWGCNEILQPAKDGHCAIPNLDPSQLEIEELSLQELDCLLLKLGQRAGKVNRAIRQRSLALALV